MSEENSTVDKVAHMIVMCGAKGVPALISLSKALGEKDEEIAKTVEGLCKAAAKDVIEMVINDYEKAGKDASKLMEKVSSV